MLGDTPCASRLLPLLYGLCYRAVNTIYFIYLTHCMQMLRVGLVCLPGRNATAWRGAISSFLATRRACHLPAVYV